jgi:transposase
LEFDIQLSQSAVLKLLKKLKQTRKQVQVTAKQCDEELERAWRQKRIGWHFEQLVFLDESGSNERTANRKWGYAPIGMPAKAKRWLKKSERWSVLLVYTISGYIEAITYQGSITAEIFENWLEQQVLPNCNRWQGDRNIIIIDNALIHKSDRVVELYTAAGCTIEYLPPYALWFNPIEESFHDLKQYIRRY